VRGDRPIASVLDESTVREVRMSGVQKCTPDKSGSGKDNKHPLSKMPGAAKAAPGIRRRPPCAVASGSPA
jgi:hypothetical protein